MRKQSAYYTFTVTLSSSGQRFSTPADKSIATVLTENGIDIPISCEIGMCGTCLAPVESGKADHRDTVQSDEEKTGTFHDNPSVNFSGRIIHLRGTVEKRIKLALNVSKTHIRMSDVATPSLCTAGF
ncbi:2Fe-2S iron-sulfur cluster binding domain-containing protein [Enterobacter asburiae]|nr:2Fe-2S iron-sulfur cluster binding domain-containing protein [Enterobacter asburiae]